MHTSTAAPVALPAGPRPLAPLSRPLPRRDRKRRVPLLQLLDRDFDDLDLTGSLAG
jgi:hypothetical protein